MNTVNTSEEKQWQQFYKKHHSKLIIGQIVAVFCFGMFVHWTFTGGKMHDDYTPTIGVENGKAETFWTCSMHPNIRQPQPGKCPICGMDLIPVTSSLTDTEAKGLRQITISKAARALLNVQASPVERRFVTAEIRMVGKVSYDETRLRYITAWVPGRLDRLYVDYTGVAVNKGDHMAYIYSPELYATQDELIQLLKSAKERKGETILFSEEINLIDAARERLRLWGMTKEQIQEIEKRKKPSDHLTIYAPAGGIVIHKNRQEGDYVTVGERIYTIAELSQLWVLLDAYESDLVWLHYGQEVIFTTEAYPGDKFIGRIAFIDPVLNEKTRTVKVRVNVPNEEGKLKPEMFVRGIVRAQVAAGGRVIHAGLAGKWICPMHPEIVKSDPLKCDKCGMPLASSESLGYVVIETDEAAKPLVIPVSAALVTGTRAIVYVEIPDTDHPTFEGREIVLGPRAGDYYLVKNGLKEGEIVVTNGNFKIDSAVQIHAMPSMMTPEGAGGDVMIEIPVEFRTQLEQLQITYGVVSKSIESGDFSQIQRAFLDFEMAFQGIEGSLLTGQAKRIWNELSMLLDNDVVEARELNRLGDANRVFRLLQEHMQRVRRQFGILAVKYEPQMHRLKEIPGSFHKQLAGVWPAYLQVQDTLASDDLKTAIYSIGRFRAEMSMIDDTMLENETLAVWKDLYTNIINVLKDLGKGESLDSIREAFSVLSENMAVILKTFQPEEIGPVYQLHCPMAFDGRGAIWLQREEEVRNPYFGLAMLRCSDRVEALFPDDQKKTRKGLTHE